MACTWPPPGDGAISPRTYTAAVADLSPAYLISGDDDERIDAWRARVRARAEAEGGPGALRTFDARTSDPGDVAAALSAMSLVAGTRYLLAEDVGAWKPASLDPLESALAHMPPDAVLVLVARGTAPPRLASAVKAADGEAREYAAPKPRALPRWTVERARELGVELDQDAAVALVAGSGPRPQRLARELEKLALAVHPRSRVTAEDVQALSAGDGAPKAYELADALVAGDLPATLALAEELLRRDERPGRLLYPIVRRLREVHRAAELIEAGVPEAKVVEDLRAPSWLAKRLIAQARRTDRATLERSLCAFAELELELRGGSPAMGSEGAAPADEDTAFTLALARGTGAPTAAPSTPSG